MPFNIQKNPYNQVSGGSNQFRSRPFTSKPHTSGRISPFDLSPSELTRADKIGAGAAALGGIAEMGLSAKAMGDEAKGIPTLAPQMQLDNQGRPMYNLSQFANETSSIRPQGATGGEVLGGAAKGVGIGLNPALMAATGGLSAPIGALVGAGAAALGGKRRKRIMTDKKRKATESLSSRQQEFNQANIGHSQNQLAQEQYYNQLNDPSRLYNLYRR